MLSVNQLNANIKLLEIWKALNVDDYPLKVKRQEVNPQNRATRADLNGRPKEIRKTTLAQKTSVSDSIYIWNRAPDSVTKSLSLYQAKKEIKIFSKSLPL